MNALPPRLATGPTAILVARESMELVLKQAVVCLCLIAAVACGGEGLLSNGADTGSHGSASSDTAGDDSTGPGGGLAFGE